MAVALAAPACSDDGSIDAMTGSTVGKPTVTSATLTGSIIEILLMPWPEGPQKVAYRNPPTNVLLPQNESLFQDMLDVLGWPSPNPCPNPSNAAAMRRTTPSS